VICVESLDFLAYFITSWISKKEGRHYQATMVTRALQVIRTESLGFLVYSFTAGFLERGRHYQATTVTRALLVICVESLEFLVYSIYSSISRKGQALPSNHGYQGITSDPYRKPGLSGVFHYQLDF